MSMKMLARLLPCARLREERESALGPRCRDVARRRRLLLQLLLLLLPSLVLAVRPPECTLPGETLLNLPAQCDCEPPKEPSRAPGTVLPVAGLFYGPIHEGTNLSWADVRMDSPRAIAVGDDGALYVADGSFVRRVEVQASGLLNVRSLNVRSWNSNESVATFVSIAWDAGGGGSVLIATSGNVLRFSAAWGWAGSSSGQLMLTRNNGTLKGFNTAVSAAWAT